MITDEQAKEILYMMLPDKLGIGTNPNCGDLYKVGQICWLIGSTPVNPVIDTEWDCIARLAEETLTPDKWERYSNLLMVVLRDSDASLKGSNISARYKTPHATWQQRAEAMGK